MTRARGDDNDDFADDLRSWGVEPEEAAKLLKDTSDPVFEVDPENWDALVLFMRCQTQWTVGGMGQRVGLNYPGVECVARLSAVELTPDRFDQLQLLEMTVINELNRRAASGKTPSRSRNKR